MITPKGKTILIDGGENNGIIVPYLLDRGITKLDYIIISHFDEDHVGGILRVIQELKVNEIIVGKQLDKTVNYEKLLEILNKRKIRLAVVGATSSRPRNIIIDKDIFIEFLWPTNSNLITENPLNNNSLVCKLEYKSFSMIFTGDIEEIAEKKLLQEYRNSLEALNSTILKVAHHGSNTSSILDFAKAVQPKIALIGAGENNKFGHPNGEVLKRLELLRYKNI